VSDLPAFTACPSLRCGQAVALPDRAVCGVAAYWEAPGLPGTLPVYRCATHRQPTDRPIAPPLIYRRISIAAEVVFAGAGQPSGPAREEALARLRRAVADVGGLFNLLNVTDVVGRYTPPAPAAKAKGGRGRAL